MYRKIATAVVALALFAGTTTLSFAQNAGGASNPSSAQGSQGKLLAHKILREKLLAAPVRHTIPAHLRRALLD